jgi:hypothetical protein
MWIAWTKKDRKPLQILYRLSYCFCSQAANGIYGSSIKAQGIWAKISFLPMCKTLNLTPEKSVMLICFQKLECYRCHTLRWRWAFNCELSSTAVAFSEFLFNWYFFYFFSAKWLIFVGNMNPFIFSAFFRGKVLYKCRLINRI